MCLAYKFHLVGKALSNGGNALLYLQEDQSRFCTFLHCFAPFCTFSIFSLSPFPSSFKWCPTNVEKVGIRMCRREAAMRCPIVKLG